MENGKVEMEGLQSAGMGYAEATALSASLAANPESQLSIHFRNAFARRIAAIKEGKEKMKMTGRKRRVAVPFVLDQEKIYSLTQRYPQFDLLFKQTERVCGALAKTVITLTVERLFDFFKKSWLSTVAYGFSLNSLVSSNRHWVHLCVAREDVDVSARGVKDDRVMCAILNAAKRKGYPLPMTDMYAKGQLESVCCGDPVTCKRKADVGLMMLHETDTNYKQVATWMYQHTVRFAYIAFISTKAIELGYDAEIPELDACVMHSGDKYSVVYKNAVSMGRMFSRKNYLSLVGQTHEVIGDYLFTKEFCGWQDAIAVYKITMVKREFSYETTVYKSWLNVGYETRYLVKSFRLKGLGYDAFRVDSYEPFQFEVSRDLVDKLTEYARRLEPDVFNHMTIARRLRSLATTTVVGGYSIVSNPVTLTEDQFEHLVLTVYSTVFMGNYRRGVSLAFQKQEAQAEAFLLKMGALKLMPYVLYFAVRHMIRIPVSTFFSWFRRFYDEWFGSRKLELSEVIEAPSFVEYSDRIVPGVWSEIGDWLKFWKNPWDGFCPYLPGFDVVMQYGGRGEYARYSRTVAKEIMDAMTRNVFGDELIKLPETVASSDSSSVTSVGPYTLMKPKLSAPVVSSVVAVAVPIEVRPTLHSDDVRRLTAKVLDNREQTLNMQSRDLVRYIPLVPSLPFADTHNGLVDQPLQLLQEVMGRIFPQSTLMQTDYASADIHYGSMELMARAVRIKIDPSKLSPLKPEKIYRPRMPNQLLPNAKQTMQAALPTVVKRNLNTTSSVDPLDVDEMWERTWAYMKAVYYVPDVEQRLAQMEDLLPTYETVARWASGLDPASRERALDQDYRDANLLRATKHSMLMLKGKRKANLGASYDTAVKAAQSIQFDSSKVRTAVYSPMFAEKVYRDKSVLKDNVFIMQSKSPSDLRKFLSAFTWHDQGNGKLRYMEIDAEMFDKSQILTTLMMHWKKAEKFGMLPDYVALLREGSSYRSATSIQAGVKAFITPQRGSGDSDTLDGNCDVSQAAYAKFFSTFVSQIEFILIMGDDVTVGFRGEVDYSHLEADCMKEFNLSVKLIVSDYGYFVSGWIVHYPDGSISWCTDPIKRAVSLGDQSVGEMVDLDERFVGYNDLCKGLEGYALQTYVSEAAARRYSDALGTQVDFNDVLAAIKCVVTVASSKKRYLSFFSSELFKRTA